MSSLSAIEKQKLERLFQMSSGYVLNFSNRSFRDFFIDEANIDINSEKYVANGGSKANKLRAFWKLESDNLVGKMIISLIDYWVNINPSPNQKDILLADQCRRIAQCLLSVGPDLIDLKHAARKLDADYLADQIHRMEQSIDADPSLAIGTAKELIETCCKTILAERNVSIGTNPDISDLTKAVFKELKLVPEGIPDRIKGSETIKIILSNLGSISKRLAELRSLYGTGHGKEGKAKGLTPRHAKLAVRAAATLVTFLFETHSETKS